MKKITCHRRKKNSNETITTKIVCLGISQQYSGLKKCNRNNFDNNNNNNNNNNNIIIIRRHASSLA